MSDDKQFPWYARVLGWLLEKVFGKSEGQE